MPPKKSIFKQPGARHFQLVHRSQRDPLIHDPEASTHVLKPINKGQSRVTLEQSISPSDLAHDLERANIGEASLYGVYYDDTEYDYMQHLRDVGAKEEGVESILIEAPASSKHPGKSGLGKKGKGKSRRDDIRDLDLPSESLPSKEELTREQVYNSQGSIPVELEGFQPDMNPHLRQTLEALEDDAFVDESLEDDFFSELVGDGELEGDPDELEFEFREEGIDEGEETEREEEEGDRRPGSTSKSQGGDEEEDEGWEARFARFKREHEAKTKKQHQDQLDSDDDLAASEGGDTVGHLPSISVIGGKKRRKGSSEASGYSMTSSSMFRNEGLTLLDERFDQVEKQYESDSDDHPSPNSPDSDSDSDSDSAPELLTSREDFNAIMDDFLDNYEIIGGKMRPVLPGETVSDKLGTLRQSLRDGKDDHKDKDDDGGGFDPRVLIRRRDEEEEEESDDTFEEFVEDKKDRWDCETILSTYSNLENHPKLIRARDATKAPKIQLDPKTGLPSLKPSKREKPHAPTDEDSPTTRSSHVTTARKKGEAKDEKRARKQAAKEDRQERRAEKKATQTKFANERRQQLTALSNSKRGVKKL